MVRFTVKGINSKFEVEDHVWDKILDTEEGEGPSEYQFNARIVGHPNHYLRMVATALVEPDDYSPFTISG